MNTEFLAATFGLTANPANQPGGTNYATGGALNSQTNTSGNLGAIPTATQIANYLSANGGVANPNALYVISSGGNDITHAEAAQPTLAAQLAEVHTAASDLVAAIAKLRAAGARTIIVPNQPASLGSNPVTSALLAAYNSALWPGLAAAGINFVPADINTVLNTVKGNVQFGITATGTACTKPAGIASGWSTLCSPTSSISTLVSPDAAQTHLFADDLHLTTAGQKIVADYEASLLMAPSMISMLAEAPVKTRAIVIGAIENQIPISQRLRGPSGFNVWVTGDVGRLSISNAPFFPNDPGTPVNLISGVDHRFANGWLLGLALSYGTQRAEFDRSFGNFRMDEYAVSAYAAQSFGPAWVRLIGSYGRIDDSVTRNAPIGIAVLTNTSHTHGGNLSLAADSGYDLMFGAVTHGPVAGLTLQRVRIGAFTEAGSFTALSFAEQTRNSAISAIGYQAAIDIGVWRPFAKAVWNHEWVDTDRQIATSLTTVAAPSYSLPAVVLGRDWGTATAGASVKVTDRVTGYAAYTSQFAQHALSVYGGQLGLNAAF